MLIEVDTDQIDPKYVDSQVQIIVKSADGKSEIGRATFYVDNPVCSSSSDLRPVNAVASASIAGGKLAIIQVDESGSGYAIPPIISIEKPHDPPHDKDETARAHANVAGGKITRIDIDNPGNGYENPPAVIISREATAQAHIDAQRVSSISLLNQGSGYNDPPFVTVDPPHPNPSPDDVTAVAHAVLNSDGTIRTIVVDDGGANYTDTPKAAISRTQRFPEFDQCLANTRPAAGSHHIVAINAASKAARIDNLSVCDTPTQQYLLSKQGLFFSSNENVTFVVCNKNPFRYKYSLSEGTSKIENDDLSAFLGALNPAGAASKAADTASSQTQNSTSSNKTKMDLAGLAPLKTEEMILENQKTNEPPFAEPAPDSYAACVTHVASDLDEIETEYASFIPVYESLAMQVRDDPTLTCKNRVAKARVLFNRSTEFAWTANLNKLSQEILRYQSIGDKRSKAIDAISGNSLASSQKGIYQAVQGGLTADNCIVQNATKSLVANLSTSVIQPLRDILGSRNAFTFTSQEYLYPDPTKIHWSLTVQSKPSEQQLGSLAAASGQDFTACFANPSDSSKPKSGSQNNATSNSDNSSSPADTGSSSLEFTPTPIPKWGSRAAIVNMRWAVFRKSQDDTASASQKPKSTDPSGAPQNGGQAQDKSNNKAAPAPADTHEIHSGDIMLGSPRFLASTGLTVVALRKQEFQQVTNPGTAGTTSTGTGSGASSGAATNSSFVAYKSNSLARISPMIFAHMRLGPDRYARSTFDRSRDWWMTFGITGQSDSKGVYPEYMVGFSHGFWDDWSLITAGAYFGQKQKPVSGYEVGKTLPSGFSGDIPVERNYKVGFGIALSLRIPGTSAPKTKSSSTQSNSSDTSGGQ